MATYEWPEETMVQARKSLENFIRDTRAREAQEIIDLSAEAAKNPNYRVPDDLRKSSIIRGECPP